jgi:RHS repeat-associated protein
MASFKNRSPDTFSTSAALTSSPTQAEGAPGLTKTDQPSVSTASKETQPTQAIPFATPTLPKGGGAIQGIGEKFQFNPVTGTAGLTIPLSADLALSYSSGSGESPFGLGWSLTLPSIMRKTDKGLPQYLDQEESDVFLLGGAEDLVPLDSPITEDTSHTFYIKRYCPRIEGSFARIERWQHQQTGESHWRIFSPDNHLQVYGLRPQARLFDRKNPRCIFQWQLEASFDDKGHATLYSYKREDQAHIDRSWPQEKHRLENSHAFNQLYLKRVYSGNQDPCQRESFLSELLLQAGNKDDQALANWHFQMIFDYGEHSSNTPKEVDLWSCRQDPFSSFRAGFEIRTYRLCHRVLTFHHFPELGPTPSLVRSTDFHYHEDPSLTLLTSVEQVGYTPTSKKALPPLEFIYSQPQLDDTIREVNPESRGNLPIGLDGNLYQWADLYGEGLSGILTEQGESWFYKRNLGNGQFGALEQVAKKPSLANLTAGQQTLTDLSQNGHVCLVQYAPPAGYSESDHEGNWGPFIPFDSQPKIDWNDPQMRWIDLNGDGYADLLITHDDVFTWYPSLAKTGFGEAEHTPRPSDEEKGPALVFADAEQTIYLADMSGDGLTDLVRIRNGEICYWPNMGYGKFGAKVTMDHPPIFDTPDLFDHRYIRLGDINGTGTADLLYIGQGQVRYWLNQAGNSWSQAHTIFNFPPVDQLSSVQLVDLLGQGTLCLVWSSPFNDALRYIDLMCGIKSHLLTTIRNNLGSETRLHYSSSTRFYLEDLARGEPWVTQLPFPVQVIDRIEVYDWISQIKSVTTSRYRHGFYDGVEREFRGFAYVEQQDTETWEAFKSGEAFANTDPAFHLPATLTKSWFHSGAYLEYQQLLQHFKDHEYYKEDKQAAFLPNPTLPQALSTPELREAFRGLKGQPLRQEIYAQDGTLKSLDPYSVTETNYVVKLLQPQEARRHAVFFIHPQETLTYHYERNPKDPRISHEMVLDITKLGQVKQSASLVYPRRQPVYDEQGKPLTIYDEQKKLHLTYTENDFTDKEDPIDTLEAFRLPTVYETRQYEIEKLSANGLLDLETVRGVCQKAETIPYEEKATTIEQKRLLSCQRILFLRDDLSGSLPFGQIDSLGLPYQQYQMALTPGLITKAYTDPDKPGGFDVDTALLTDGGKYIQGKQIAVTQDELKDEVWWIPSGVQQFDAAHFYLPIAFTDPFGATTHVVYDPHFIAITNIEDPLHNKTTALFDYRVLQPWQITDPNGNRAEAAFDELGLVIATAVIGKAGEGDALIFPKLDDMAVSNHLAHPLQDPQTILGQATTRILYDVWRYYKTKAIDPQGREHGEPSVSYALTRETHISDLKPGEQTAVQHAFAYSDGSGRVVQTKMQAEPLQVPGQPLSPRWIASGWTLFNNKGLPIKQYESFFTDTHDFKFAVQKGISATLFYDPLGRAVATLYPNHTYTKVVFTPWQKISWDANDTVVMLDPRQDPDVGDFFTRLKEEEFLPTWYSHRSQGQLGDAEKAAADQTWGHRNTPTAEHLDTLGRPFLVLNQQSRMHTTFDIQRRAIVTRDALVSTSDPLGRIALTQSFDMAGRVLTTHSVDAGKRWMLGDVTSKPLRLWTQRGHTFLMTYDLLQRPTHHYIRESDGRTWLTERFIYGESLGSVAVAFNLRGKLYQHYEGAGLVTVEAHDFKGNLLSSSRRLAREYRTQVDWSSLSDLITPETLIVAADSLLENETFSASATYDALNRHKTAMTPDQSIFYPFYDRGGVLTQVEVSLRGETTRTPFVLGIEYDAKGQRQSIRYGNGIRTDYVYDPLTYRLSRLTTTRGAKQAILQDLYHTYDPVGNITKIRDEAQQTHYFKGQVVEPHTTYTYDPLYRLIQAQGREHIGQVVSPPNENDEWHVNLPLPSDGQAMQNYTESYLYDPLGNFLEMLHSATQGSWKRRYSYHSDHQYHADNTTASSNRLYATNVPGDLDDGPFSTRYTYDAHGNMTRMPHLSALTWDFKDQLHHLDLGGGGQAYYIYDAGGQRVRKVIERSSFLREERIYLGGFEIYRKFTPGELVFERETLHVLDGSKRIALVETKTQDTSEEALVVQPVIRYQLNNHLESSILELAKDGLIISYEEYYPFGSTSFQAIGQTQVSAKRYRYTGKERDEESGLYYHGARYYASWLGRWTSADPAGMVDGPNLYAYVRNNPIRFNDPSGMLSDEEGKFLAKAAIIVLSAAGEAAAGAAPKVAAAAVAGVELGPGDAIVIGGALIFAAGTSIYAGYTAYQKYKASSSSPPTVPAPSPSTVPAPSPPTVPAPSPPTVPAPSPTARDKSPTRMTETVPATDQAPSVDTKEKSSKKRRRVTVWVFSDKKASELQSSLGSSNTLEPTDGFAGRGVYFVPNDPNPNNTGDDKMFLSFVAHTLRTGVPHKWLVENILYKGKKLSYAAIEVDENLINQLMRVQAQPDRPPLVSYDAYFKATQDGFNLNRLKGKVVGYGEYPLFLHKK